MLLELRSDFARAHEIRYNYAKHNYVFLRRERRTVRDFYVVARTSRRCFRVMYVHLEPFNVEYFSCRSSKATALRLWLRWKKTLQGETVNIS